MGVAYKNFWSLNTDEAIVAGLLRANTEKVVEVFMPLNAQMKGIDLVLMNVENKKLVTVQVKGSRAYEPEPKEVKEYGDGSPGWFFFSEKVISKATADYFAFLIYVLEENNKKGRRIIAPHVVLIPTIELQKKSKKCKNTRGGDMLCYYIWVNPKTKESFDYRDKKMDLSKYLDKKGFLLLNKILV